MPLHQAKEGITVAVKVQPKAKKDEILGVEGNRLKLKVKAVPEKGKANDACINLLAKTLSVSKKEIKLISGARTREKVFLIQNIKLDDLKQKLGIL